MSFRGGKRRIVFGADMQDENGCMHLTQMSEEQKSEDATKEKPKQTNVKSLPRRVLFHVRKCVPKPIQTRPLSLHQLLVENPQLLYLAFKRCGVRVVFHWASDCETLYDVVGEKWAQRYLDYIDSTLDIPYTKYGDKIAHEVMEWNENFIRKLILTQRVEGKGSVEPVIQQHTVPDTTPNMALWRHS